MDSLLSEQKIEEASNYIKYKKYQNENFKKLDKVQVSIAQKKVDSSTYYLLDIDTTIFDTYKKARYYTYLAKTYQYNNDADIAYSYYEKGYLKYIKLGSKKEANEILLQQFQILVAQDEYITKAYRKLESFGKNALSNNWEKQIANYYTEKGIDHFYTETKDSVSFYFNKAENALIKIKDSLALYRLYITRGVFYTEIQTILDSSLYYHDKALKINKNKEGIYYNLVNKANSYRKEKDFKTSIKLLEDALKNLPINFRKKNLKILYGLLAKDYESIGNTNKSLEYLKLQKDYADSLNTEAQNINLIKYQTAEKERQILEQENKILDEQSNRAIAEADKKRSQSITYGLSIFLFLGSIIAFLIYRNVKRKQRIAEQDRELQIQKTEKVLKEKEIETINAMVSGQEKERLRLAGELHDNLGSTLATVRMQVENLERNLDKVDDPKELLKKTHTLVNEAYDKVRSISHERNSGVMAKDGLLPAVQKLARTVSNANSLTVDVQDFGLENRIANELEITIFRIIQELVTNIVKHAHASEASISLTQHDNELNIMVEDNGKGFKVGKLQDKDGIGLGSIERRIEHLEGSMEVDSAIGRGTSISIDIPL